MVEVAGETLVVPLNLVIETLTLSDLQVDMIRPGVMSIRVRGSFVPVFDLGVALGYREPVTCTVLGSSNSSVSSRVNPLTASASGIHCSEIGLSLP